jgi:hypothetical protein
MLADMVPRVEAAPPLCTGHWLDAGAAGYQPGVGHGQVVRSDTAMSVTTGAVQLFGGPVHEDFRWSA